MKYRTTFAFLAMTAALPAATKVFQAFEGDGLDGWQAEGAAFGMAPAGGRTDDMESPFTAYSGDSLIVSAHGGDAATGTLSSPEFSIEQPYITFLIGGGNEAGKTAAQLIVDGKPVREAVGTRNLRMAPMVWDVADLKGKKATIRLVDAATGSWGVIAVDHIMFTDNPNKKFPATTRAGKPFVDNLQLTKALPGANIPKDTTLTVAADYKGQKITSPTAITFDDEGRVLVAETHRFREGVEDDRDNLFWYLDDLASMKTSDRLALHEKWKDKVSLEHMTSKSELIRRLADSDGDGKFEESTVFADDFNDVLDGTAAGIFYYDGCIYFACIPKIYMMRDQDGGGAADARKVVQDGFGVRISLSGHDLNGFTLGPDGRIWGTTGDRGLSFVTKEGRKYEYPDEGLVYNFEPDGSDFQIFHTGLRNPKEIAFDDLGNPFSVDNNSDQGDASRIVYLVEGGESGWQMEHQAMHTFHRQIGLEEHPPSRWMDGKMWEMRNPSQPAYIVPPAALLTAGPSGLTFHPGAGFLKSEVGRFLICDYRGGAANSGIWSFQMKPDGAGMAMADSRRFLWGVAATDVEYSWDGRVFVSDFVTGWESHEDGRLLSLDAGKDQFLANEVAGTVRIMKQGFEDRSSAELANLLRHPDMRIRLRAQIALTRHDDAVSRFTEAADSSDFHVRLHGIWGLGIAARRGFTPRPFSEFEGIPDAAQGAAAAKKLAALLDDSDAEIRAQALRALASSRATLDLPLGPLLADASPRVRFFAAIAAGKLGLTAFYGPILDLLRENDNRDAYLRHAGIYALQHLAENPNILTGLVADESPAIRLAAVVALRRLKNPDVSRFLADADPAVADEAIRAIGDLDIVSRRPQAAALLDNLGARKWSPFMLRRLIENAFRVGTAEDAARVVKVAADAGMPEIVRKEAFRLLREWTKPFPVDQLTGHWNPLEKRADDTVAPTLAAALPDLLTRKDFALAAALDLAAKYQLEAPGLDSPALEKLAEDTSLPAAARGAAMRLVIARQPENLADFLGHLAGDPANEVALTALESIAKLTPEAATPALEAAVNSADAARTQQTWRILDDLRGPAIDGIFVKQLTTLTAAKGVSTSGIELLAAAAKRKSPEVVSALAAYNKAISDSPNPLAKWNIALDGGDPAAGRALFESHPASECMRCHRAEDGHAAGGETAPNLAGIGKRHDRPYFLESMIQPSATIAPGFGTVMVNFKNGASLTGNVLDDTADHLDVDSEGKSLRLSRSDIDSVSTPVSPMPPMGDLLKPAEMRDVIAFLAGLTEGGERPAAVEPAPFDPATLVKSEPAPAPQPAEKPIEKPAEPAIAAAAPPAPEPAAESTAPDPAVMKTGSQQFMLCGACHGQKGEGTPAGPPLAASEWVGGPAENLIRIQLRGLVGPIEVKGQTYNIAGGMAPLAYQTDEQISAVLTYVRNSFGNSAPPVAPADITALRGEVGKPQLVVADLIPLPIAAEPGLAPADSAEPGKPPAAENPASTGKYADLEPADTAIWRWLGLAALLALIAFMSTAFRKKSDH